MILSGCASSAKKEATTQAVRGTGFAFEAPIGWRVEQKQTSTAVSHGKVDRIEVFRFKLEKLYRVANFHAVSGELDGVAAKLATQLKGRVVRRSTVRLARRKARSYRIDYGTGRTDEIGFVLIAKTEYQLLCRRPTSGSDSACAMFFSTFALG